MKTITTTTTTTNVYEFNELSEEAKQSAIESLYDINVDYDWYSYTYEDAKTIGLEITSFDIDRASYCNGSLLWSAPEVANTIIANHGETCDTYILAKSFLANYDKLVEKYSDGVTLNVVSEDNEYDFDQEADELEEEFTKDLREEYLSILTKEFEYLSSKAAIIDTIEANDYDFTEDGKLF